MKIERINDRDNERVTYYPYGFYVVDVPMAYVPQDLDAYTKKTKRINRHEFDGEWPFIDGIDYVDVHLYGDDIVTVTSKKKYKPSHRRNQKASAKTGQTIEYAINGIARHVADFYEFEDITRSKSIWRVKPESARAGIYDRRPSMEPIIKIALSMVDDNGQ